MEQIKIEEKDDCIRPPINMENQVNPFNILITDSDPFVRSGLRQDLTYEGYLVDTAENSDIALRKLRSARYDLIISELMIELMDGMEVIKTARRLQPEILAIAMSGFGNAGLFTKQGGDSVDETIIKPCESEEINKKIRYCRMKAELIRKSREFTLHSGKMQESGKKIRSVLLSLSNHPDLNIHRITKTARTILRCAGSIYNRYNPQKGILHTISSSGNLKNNELAIITNLSETSFSDSDPNVKQYGFVSYIGVPVSIKGATRGTLCAVYTHHHEFSPMEIETLKTLAQIITLEESRRSAGNFFPSHSQNSILKN